MSSEESVKVPAEPEYSFEGWGLELLAELDPAQRFSRNALVIEACRRGLVREGFSSELIGDALVLPTGFHIDRPWTYDVHTLWSTVA